MKCSTAIILFALASACSNRRETQSIALIVDVVDDRQTPFSGADVFIDSQSLGATEGRGRVTAQLKGPEGRKFRVRVACPSGWTVEGDESKELSIRFLKPIDRNDGVLAPMEEIFKCVPVTRKVVVLVRADGMAGLPIVAMGREMTRTDEDGVAQSVLEGIPGDEIEVGIDTSSYRDIRPSMPSRRFIMPTKNQILIFDQKFEKKRKKSRSGRRRVLKYSGPKRI